MVSFEGTKLNGKRTTHVERDGMRRQVLNDLFTFLHDQFHRFIPRRPLQFPILADLLLPTRTISFQAVEQQHVGEHTGNVSRSG